MYPSSLYTVSPVAVFWILPSNELFVPWLSVEFSVFDYELRGCCLVYCVLFRAFLSMLPSNLIAGSIEKNTFSGISDLMCNENYYTPEYFCHVPIKMCCYLL